MPSILSWSATVQLSKPGIYIVSQVKRGYVILLLDIDNEGNNDLLKEAPVLIQIVTRRLLNPTDPILVRSYQLCIFQRKQAELPLYG